MPCRTGSPCTVRRVQRSSRNVKWPCTGASVVAEAGGVTRRQHHDQSRLAVVVFPRISGARVRPYGHFRPSEGWDDALEPHVLNVVFGCVFGCVWLG